MSPEEEQEQEQATQTPFHPSPSPSQSQTSPLELLGWYSTGLAAEIYAVCGVGSFAPVALEQLAREAGVLRSDGASSCVANGDMAEGEVCVVKPFFGREVATPSFAMYTFSVAVAVQACVLVMVSGVGDFGTFRKRLLYAFAFSGAVGTMVMVFVWPGVYLLGSMFTIIAVVCLGSTFVLLNSFLPLLAANHPSVAHMKQEQDDRFTTRPSSLRNATSPQLKLSTQISSKGVGLGYAAAVSVQILCILLLVLLKKANFASESTPIRFILLLVGISWFLLTIPGFRYLRNRPGPPLPNLSSYSSSRVPVFLQYIRFACTSIWKTIKLALKLRHTCLFLLAWFLLSDAIATVSGTAILFARTELHMGTIPIALLSITATCSGIAGAFLWPHIARYFHLQTKQTILACILLMGIIPLYGLLGFLPFIKSLGYLGLQQVWEIYPLGVVHGFVMGGLSSYCRAFYGEIIPPGSEAAFYALYAITDKGSSAVGPAIVGLIVDRTGTIRPAFGFLAALILITLPVVWKVDAMKGREEARALGRSVEEVRMEDFEIEDEEEEEDRAGLLREVEREERD